MKPVIAKTEIGANCVFHMAALAKAGFESDYVSNYESAVSAEDLGALRFHADRINFSFGSGGGGDLSGLLLSEPGYLNLDTRERLQHSTTSSSWTMDSKQAITQPFWSVSPPTPETGWRKWMLRT